MIATIKILCNDIMAVLLSEEFSTINWGTYANYLDIIYCCSFSNRLRYS